MSAVTEWKTTTIGSLATVSRGASPRPIASPRWFDNGSKVGWVRIADVNRSDGRTLLSTTQALSPDGVARSRYLEPGSLIMSIAATVGIPIITGVSTCIHDGFVALENLKIDQSFMLYLLKTSEGSLREAGQSGSQMNVNTDIVKEVPVRVPVDRNEQERIAAALWDADDLIAALERLIAKKQAIKQGMMQQLLAGRTRLPGYTGPWAAGTFGELATLSQERTMPQDVPATTPLVDLDQVESGSGRLTGWSQASEAVSLKAVFNPGDVLFGKLRAYLRKFWHADVAGLCTTEIWVLRAKAGADGGFVRYLVETDEFIDAASGAYGTHMPRSDWGTVRALPVAIPPPDEQMAIASALGSIDAEIEHLFQRVAKARHVKTGMMQQLLTGRTRLPVEGAS